jgi:hypothetical protein
MDSADDELFEKSFQFEESADELTDVIGGIGGCRCRCRGNTSGSGRPR